MLFELKKAVEAVQHPGIDANPVRLVRNSLPYYLPGSMEAAAPLTIYWSINSVCNLRCAMCDVGTNQDEGTFFKNLRIDRQLAEIPLQTFKSVIDEVRSDKPFVAINSTEPLLYKPIGEAIAYCTHHGLKTGVTTGGYALPQKAEELVKAGLSRLSVSIDGPPDIHNRIRGRADSFQKSTAGIQKFKDSAETAGLKPEIVVSCVITPLNYLHLADYYASIEKLPIDRINFAFQWFISPDIATEHNHTYGSRYPVTASCFGEDVRPDLVDTDSLHAQMEIVKRKPRVSFLPYFNKSQLKTYFHEPQKHMSRGSSCLASWFFVQILANGNVIPYTRCHNESFGNILKTPFKQIWNGEPMQDWRRFIRVAKKMPMCRRCDLVY